MQLDELGFVGRGKSKHRPRNDPTLYGGEYPFVQTGDVKEAELWLTHYSQTYNQIGLAQSKLWPVGTLCITIAANIAETAILKIPACFPDSIVGFIPHSGKADARFIKYYIDTIKLRMQNASKGTTQDNLSVDKLLSFDFQVPSYQTQEQIASILSAYDGVIENNARRIRILEEMAQMIYREWFVNFRFPGHEKVKIVESEIGPIPSGWRVKTIGEIATVRGGKRLAQGKSVVDTPTEHPYLRVKDMCEWGVELSDIKYIDEETHQPISRYTITSKEIYISIAGTIGRVGIVPTKISGANLTENAAKISDVKEISQHLLLSYLRSPTGQHQIASKVVGTSQPKLALFRIEEIKVPVPPKSLQQLVTPFLSSVHDQTEMIQRKTFILRQTRDLILRKLISGEVSVEQFEAEAIAQGL